MSGSIYHSVDRLGRCPFSYPVHVYDVWSNEPFETFRIPICTDESGEILYRYRVCYSTEFAMNPEPSEPEKITKIQILICDIIKLLLPLRWQLGLPTAMAQIEISAPFLERKPLQLEICNL